MPEQLSIDKIMNRIKSTLESAKKNRKTLEKNEFHSNHNFDFNFVKFSSEIEQNNRNWNVSPEYVLTSHRPFIGKFIVLGKKIIRKFLRWYINPVFEKQRNFNGSVTRSLNDISPILADIIKDIEFLKEKNTRIDEIETEILNNIKESNQRVGQSPIDLTFNNLEQTIESIELILNNHKKMEEDFGNIEHIVNMQMQLEQNLKNVEERLASIESIAVKQKGIEDNIKEIIERINAVNGSSINNNTFDAFKNSLYKDLQNINEKIEKTDDLIILVNSRIKKNANNIVVKEKDTEVKEKENTKETSLIPSEESKLEMDYFLFEQKFRGTRSVIMERQRDYLPLFVNKKDVLDIGCGRGEFIELLQKEQGIRVKGIDINSDMIGYCKERGFDVELVDAIDYLGQLSDNSLDGIFMAQVIEHLTSDQAMNLINAVYRVLKPGGLFVVETINVQSVFAMSNWFYMDPTHVKPVHPVTLKFIFQGSGYSQVDIKYLSPVPDKGVPHLQIDGVDLSQFNESLNDLNGLIYGYQDYAICAYK